jgi:uncharacterized caspase-like protein
MGKTGFFGVLPPAPPPPVPPAPPLFSGVFSDDMMRVESSQLFGLNFKLSNTDLLESLTVLWLEEGVYCSL